MSLRLKQYNLSGAADLDHIPSGNRWLNSGLCWDSSIGKWKPSKSGASVGNLSELTIDVDKDWNDKSVYNLTSISSTIISGGTIRTNTFYINANMISGLTQPTYNSGAANKRYVDIISGNLDTKIDAAGGTLAGSMVGNIGSDFTYGLSGLKYISSQIISGGTIKLTNITGYDNKIKWTNNTLSTSGTVNISGLTTFKRFNYPVIEIVRNTAYTGTFIDGARLTKNQVTGGDSDGGGLGFVFNIDDSAGNTTIAGKFGGLLANADNGAEIGEVGMAGSYQGADISQIRGISARAIDTTHNDVQIEHRLRVGKYRTFGNNEPIAYTLDVSGSTRLISGSLYVQHGGISSQSISGNSIKVTNVNIYGNTIIAHQGFDLGDYKLQVSGNSYFSGNVILLGNISGVSTPTYNSGASNKYYVDLVSDNTRFLYKGSSNIWNFISSQLISGGTIIGKVPTYSKIVPFDYTFKHANVVNTPNYFINTAMGGLLFTNDGTTANNYVVWSGYIPDDYLEGSYINIKLRWCSMSSTVGATPSGVVFDVQWNSMGAVGEIVSAVNNVSAVTGQTAGGGEAAYTIHETIIFSTNSLSRRDNLSYKLWRAATNDGDNLWARVFTPYECIVEYSSNSF